MTEAEAAARLVRAGHLHAHALGAIAIDDSILGAALASYQKHHGLPITGELDPATADHLQRPRCAHPDVMADAAESRWGVLALKFWQAVAYPGVDPAMIAADFQEALARIESVSPVKLTIVGDQAQADIQAVSGPIDGEWNVLALTELPPPGAQPGSFVSHQTFDQAETGLTRSQRVAMIAHEVCHALGLGHALPGSGNLMEPVLSAIGHPQAGDVAELLARYPVTATTPDTTPTATPPSTVTLGPFTLPTITLTDAAGASVALVITIPAFVVTATPNR